MDTPQTEPVDPARKIEELEATLAKTNNLVRRMVMSIDSDNMVLNSELAACFQDASRNALEQGDYRQAAKAIYEGTINLREVLDDDILESYARSAIETGNTILNARLSLPDSTIMPDEDDTANDLSYAFKNLDRHMQGGALSSRMQDELAQTWKSYSTALFHAGKVSLVEGMIETCMCDDEETILSAAARGMKENIEFWKNAVRRGIQIPPAP